MKIVKPNDIPAIIKEAKNKSPLFILKLCLKMQIICEQEGGIGLAAPQVGEDLHVFLVKGDGTCPFIAKGTYGFFVDCRYEPIGDETVTSLEGCLSLKDENNNFRFFKVSRFKKIKVTGYRLVVNPLKLDIFEEEIDINQQGAVFQHESDHNIPKLISDIGTEVLIW